MQQRSLDREEAIQEILPWLQSNIQTTNSFLALSSHDNDEQISVMKIDNQIESETEEARRNTQNDHKLNNNIMSMEPYQIILHPSNNVTSNTSVTKTPKRLSRRQDSKQFGHWNSKEEMSWITSTENEKFWIQCVYVYIIFFMPLGFLYIFLSTRLPAPHNIC